MRIVLSRAAQQDLDALFDWIALDGGMDRAEAILRRIDETLFNLASSPGIGRLRRDLDGAPRSFAIWPWLILYEPTAINDGILVLRIIDGRRDLSKP
ncbi:MAG: type II toxin-antitoxin system RelE/ParE family toxin [Caulobacteraceae bacterium]